MNPLASALQRLAAIRSPLLRALVPCAAAAAAVQAVAAAPSLLARSERFYDASGSVAALAVAALSLYLPRLGRAPLAAAANWRQLAASAMAALWTLRRAPRAPPLLPAPRAPRADGSPAKSAPTSSAASSPMGTTRASTACATARCASASPSPPRPCG